MVLKKLFIFLLGLSLCAISAFLTLNTLEFLDSGIAAKGNVVSIKESRGSNNKTMYSPVVSFIDQTNKTVTFTSGRRSSIQWYDVGEEVNILYMPSNSKKASIKSFATLWLPAIISGLFGILAVLACFGSFVTPQRR